MSNYFSEICPSHIRVGEDSVEEVIEAIAKELFCEADNLLFCSLYEADFTNKEIREFEKEILWEEDEAYYHKKDSTGHTDLVRVLHKIFGRLVSETSVSKFGGTVTNFWKA